ncbi:MAG: hypothetical protein PHE51_07415 [Eubacteriales bacterium]|nr:hypothetical protein [Eubacteriales bacterium]
MDNKIVYDCRWSDNVDEKFIDDFNLIQDSVFCSTSTREDFKKQFIDNIYGPSVVTVVYIDEVPSAARALWRNDIDGYKAYQPGRTCVLGNCRGMGIFTEMTKCSIALLDENAFIYNFPNNNSFPGYLKMGWHLVKEYRPVFLVRLKNYLKEHPLQMDATYANWWVKDVEGIKYIKRGKHYFIVRQHSKRLFYHIISMVEEDIALLFPKHCAFGLCFYLSERQTFYNKKISSLHVVCKNSDIICIPTWKMDAI